MCFFELKSHISQNLRPALNRDFRHCAVVPRTCGKHHQLHSCHLVLRSLLPAVACCRRAGRVCHSWGGSQNGRMIFFDNQFYDIQFQKNVFDKKWWSSKPNRDFGAAYLQNQENPNLLISIGGLDYSSDLRELKELPNLPKERIVYEAHSYPWQKVTKVVNVALPGAIPGNASGKTHPGSLDDVWQTCTTLGDACAGITCTGTDHCYARRGTPDGPLRGAEPAHGHFSKINRFRTGFEDVRCWLPFIM